MMYNNPFPWVKEGAKKALKQADTKRKKMLNQFAVNDDGNHLPRPSKGRSVHFEDNDDMYSYYSIEEEEQSGDEKEYYDDGVFQEINRVVHTKDADLEDILDNDHEEYDFQGPTRETRVRDDQVPTPSAGITGAQAKLPKHLDWSDWHRDREEIVAQQIEEREATVSKRNRSHFNYSFIGK